MVAVKVPSFCSVNFTTALGLLVWSSIVFHTVPFSGSAALANAAIQQVLKLKQSFSFCNILGSSKTSVFKTRNDIAILNVTVSCNLVTLKNKIYRKQVINISGYYMNIPNVLKYYFTETFLKTAILQTKSVEFTPNCSAPYA